MHRQQAVTLMTRLRLFGSTCVTLLVMAACLALSSADAAAEAPALENQLLSDHPLVGHIWSPNDGDLTPSDLLERASAAHHLLLGERHGNRDHHRLQVWLFEKLLERDRRPALVFEMITEDQAEALEGHVLSGRGSEELGKVLDWQARGWPDWSLYQPLAEAALAAGLAIRPGGMASRRTQEVAGRVQQGDLPEMPESLRRGLVTDVHIAHCELMPEETLPAMAAVQWKRDRTLARAMSTPATTDGAVLITGAGHARRDRGVPWHLHQLEPGARIYSLALIEVVEGLYEPQDYAAHFNTETLPFDAAWFTPREDDTDRCEQLRELLRASTSAD